MDFKQFEECGWVLQKKDVTKEDIIGRGEFGGKVLDSDLISSAKL